jgi:hypothetical protein
VRAQAAATRSDCRLPRTYRRNFREPRADVNPFLILERYAADRRQDAGDRRRVLGRRRGANVDARSASTGRGSQDSPAAPTSDPRPAAQARDLAFPRAGRRLQPRLLHVYIATAPRPNAAPSLVFVDRDARVLDRIPLERLPHSSAVRAATHESARSRPTFRAVVYALWTARRLGFRRVAVHSDDPGAVAEINGERRIDPEAVGLYLEARALMHLYKSASIDVGELLLSVLEPWAPPSPPAAACAMPASS